MARSVEIVIAGVVPVTTRVNIRQGSPSRAAPLVRKEERGIELQVLAITAGDEVEGNRLWFRLVDGTYIWSGACGRFSHNAAAAQESPEAIEAPILPTPPLTPATWTSGEAAASAEYPRAVVVDLYHGDAVRSLEEARVAGTAGIIHKATTGETGRDDLYDDRRTLAENAGLLWGAYHWGTAKPVAAQVDNFLSYANPDEKTLVALDFEDTQGNQMTLEMAGEFLERVTEKIGQKPVIYSGHTLKTALGSRVDAFFGSHRLWLAQYGPRPVPQASWGSAWLWQFTEGKATDPRRRRVPGIPGNHRGELDCNHFFGPADELARQWVSPPPQALPPGDAAPASDGSINGNAVADAYDVGVKSTRVRIGNLHPKMEVVIAAVAETARAMNLPQPVITSGNDSKHKNGSMHYRNRALDFRGNNITRAEGYRLRDTLKEKLGTGFDVLFEVGANPANTHLHVEYDPA